MANRSPSHYPDIGVLGEDLVAKWLHSQGWVVLHRRWRRRCGEIDIIAQKSLPLLVFVEVKTRSRGNWDAGGLLSITSQKQAKLHQTAQCFLATYPHLTDYPCRFDVALVRCQQVVGRRDDLLESTALKLQLGQAVTIGGYQLNIQEYIPAAFDRS